MSLLDKIKKITSIACDLKTLFTKNNNVDINTKNKIVNQKFNDTIQNTNSTIFCDGVRKEKQKQIEELKNA